MTVAFEESAPTCSQQIQALLLHCYRPQLFALLMLLLTVCSLALWHALLRLQCLLFKPVDSPLKYY